MPDVVYGHAGPGPLLYVKDAFPDARVIGYFDWCYRPRGSNADFFPERPVDADRACLVRARNAALLADLAHCDWGVVSTEWQLAQFPRDCSAQLSLLHDGIRTDYWCPAAPLHAPEAEQPGCGGDAGRAGHAGLRSLGARLGLDLSGAGGALRLGGLVLPAGTELVTYATPEMQPHRGFPQFLRAAERLRRRRPDTHVVVAGGEPAGPSSGVPPGRSWRRRMQDEPELDPARVHFVGPLPYDRYRQLLRASSAHVYLTIPFALSASMLEAMSCGCLLVASATPPVEEFVEDGANGLLVDFLDHAQLADRLEEALEHPDGHRALRAAARRTIVERHDLGRLLPRHLRLIDDLVGGRLPS